MGLAIIATAQNDREPYRRELVQRRELQPDFFQALLPRHDSRRANDFGLRSQVEHPWLVTPAAVVRDTRQAARVSRVRCGTCHAHIAVSGGRAVDDVRVDEMLEQRPDAVSRRLEVAEQAVQHADVEEGLFGESCG